MHAHLFSRAAITLLIAALSLPLRAVDAPASAVRGPAREIVLFPFDNESLPFNKGLVLSLVAGRKHSRNDPAHPDGPVLDKGPRGAPDDRRVRFYGTVLHVGDEYRMWYGGNTAICYAVSKDGMKWEKPRLGLVEFNGNTDNNLAAIDGTQPIRGINCFVLYEPDDPDPSRRFKMLREIPVSGVSWPVYVAGSPDGLRWRALADNKPINPTYQLEPSGLIHFNGMYYVNGHSSAIRHPVPGAHKRTMQTFASPDFEHWTSAAHLSFRRDNIPPRPILDFEGHRGEQVHVGASLWDRGNVILGFYGQYHNETNDRRTSIVDIGLIVSNDAIQFREPIPDFKIIPSFEEPDRAEPRLIQGQGFHNIGDRTIAYYGIWNEVNRDGPSGVRIATWPRDQLGYYSPSPDVTDAHCISAPLDAPRSGARVFINASGLSPQSQLRLEILDEQFRPIPGYAAADAEPLEQSGFHLPVSWRGAPDLAKLDQPIRIRVNWTGAESGKARLFAVYLE